MVFSRSSLGGVKQDIRDIKEIAILTKRTFFVSEFFRGSLVLRWSFVQCIYIRYKGKNIKK